MIIYNVFFFLSDVLHSNQKICFTDIYATPICIFHMNLSKTMPISHQISSVRTDVTVTTRTRQNVWLIHYPFIFFETNFYSFVCNIMETAASSSIKFKIFCISWGHFSEKKVNQTNITLKIRYIKKLL